MPARAAQRLMLVLTLIHSGIALSAHWNYIHEDDWPPACKTGRKQSPIALSHSIAEETHFSSLIFERYEITHPVQSKNNGHSTEIRLHVEHQPTIKGGGLPDIYTLDHLHFHWDSEHTVEDVRFPLELHLVHYAPKYGDLTQALTHEGGVAVFAVLFYLSLEDDKEFEPLITAVDKIHDKIGEIEQLNLKITDYLPRDRAGFYRYNGSLTTPDCTEGIIWTVFTNPLPISQNQVKYFSLLRTEENQTLKNNYRSLQDLNGRKVQVKTSPVHSAASMILLSKNQVCVIFSLFIIFRKFM